MTARIRALAGLVALILAACGGEDATAPSPDAIPVEALKTVTVDSQTVFHSPDPVFNKCTGEYVALSGHAENVTTVISGLTKVILITTVNYPALHGVGQSTGRTYAGHSESTVRIPYATADGQSDHAQVYDRLKLVGGGATYILKQIVKYTYEPGGNTLRSVLKTKEECQ